MSNGAAVETGAGMSAQAEARHRELLVDAELDQAEQAVGRIERKIEGMQTSLKAAKAEVKRLRSTKTPSGVSEEAGS